jgi:DNA-binding MurR/RpiR family transcriptional regulator
MRPPQTYEALTKAIVERFNSLSRQLQRIAHYTTDHPDEIAITTLAEIARRIDVQPSSLVRFAQSLGFAGFSEMQRLYRSQLMLNFAHYRERATAGLPQSGGMADGEDESLLHRFVKDSIGALQRLVRDVPVGHLERAAQLLADGRHVYTLGQGRGYPVAFFVGFNLTRLQKAAVVLDGVGGTLPLRQMADLITPKDALFVSSFWPYTPLVVDVAAEKSEAGIPVVAITDSPLSPLASKATVTLQARNESEHNMRSVVAAMCLAQALTMAVGERLANTGAAAAPRPPVRQPGRPRRTALRQRQTET